MILQTAKPTPCCLQGLATVLAWMLLAVVACAPQPPRLLRISVRYPGAGAQDVERDATRPIESILAASSDIHSIISISSPGKLDAYIAVHRDAGPQEVLESISQSLQSRLVLPDAASEPVVELLPPSATIPNVQPTLVDEVVIDMKRDATLEHDVTIQDIAEVLQTAELKDGSAEERLKKLRQLRVRTPDGGEVPLTELGELRIEQTLDKTVRTWP